MWRSYRLAEDGYLPIELDATGGFVCEQLGIRLHLEAGELVLYDSTTNETLLTEADSKEAALQREREAREAAEAELLRLRKLLDERGGS